MARMARQPRPPNVPNDRPGQKPLLQGHLRPGSRPVQEAEPAAPDAAGTSPSEQPAEPTAGSGEAAKGKATKSTARVATRPHLEGSEQGPV
jgi:hypothetical protein